MGAALVTVVGAAAFASGLLGGGGNGDTGRRQALPGATVDVPEPSVPATESTPASDSPSPTASASVSPSASASASPSPSPSASAAASQSASTTPSPTTGRGPY
ncbi:hypothetical protein OG978_13185 [Streptomyces sp. NBC_01591]|uniref:hypothetical protein n=1 Tax=Streptomyces sp. NBC_01591 TaxID=2975888 RepID=UPI002DD9209F|nr:hypothetical protein [Streptomyces sp. NBC_01591]WSD68274.1 hypothetical protein OG978_13185 [Streptomyces sp. NBC_01591]